MRKASFAGQFYSDDLEELEKEIKFCFKSDFGPGSLPGDRGNKKIFGGVVPHAGYMFSGPCATHFYKYVAESKLFDAFLILGVNHYGLGHKVVISLEDWDTPFGIVQNARVLGGKLLRKEIGRNDEELHVREHSIEVQLPFLQFAYKDNLKKLKVIPLLVSRLSYEECKKLADDIIENVGKNICVIASSDFTHYGPNYGYVPFEGNVKKNIEKIDIEAVKFIERLNTEEFLEYCKGKTICGSNPIAAAMEIVKRLGCRGGRLLRYYSSGDVIKDYGNSVGYASVLFE
jgi:AmmeMemoRadiSam system protein B